MYSYKLKLQSPSKYSPFDAIHLSRRFFHCSKQFLNASILMPFSASAFFFLVKFFTYYTLAKHNCSGGDLVNKEGGAWESCTFLFKSCWVLRVVCAGVFVNHPYEMGKQAERVLKKFIEAECSLSHQRLLVHWYRWVFRTLPSRGSLYTTRGVPYRR